MKVAILTRDYPPAIGGVATHVEGLVKALRRMGVEADLYVGSNDVKTLLLPFDMPIKKYDLVHVQSLPYGAFVFGAPLVVTVHSPVLEEFAHYRRKRPAERYFRGDIHEVWRFLCDGTSDNIEPEPQFSPFRAQQSPLTRCADRSFALALTVGNVLHGLHAQSFHAIGRGYRLYGIGDRL